MPRCRQNGELAVPGGLSYIRRPPEPHQTEEAMSRKPIAVHEEYAIGPGQIRLSVFVGDRQYGTSMVFVDDELLANGAIEEVPLGTGADLKDRKVTVYTVVTDIRDKKNEISVAWLLTGGKKRLNLEKSGSAAKTFGSQMFKAVFEFTEDD